MIFLNTIFFQARLHEEYYFCGKCFGQTFADNKTPDSLWPIPLRTPLPPKKIVDAFQFSPLDASNIQPKPGPTNWKDLFLFQGSDFSWVATVKSRRGGSQVYAISDVHFDHKCNEDGAVFELLENRSHSLPEIGISCPPKRKPANLFQPSIFQGKLAVSFKEGRVSSFFFSSNWTPVCFGKKDVGWVSI